MTCKAQSNIVRRRGLFKMWNAETAATETKTNIFLICLSAGSHSVYGVLVGTIKPQPAGQFWVIMSLWRRSLLSLWTVWRSGGICRTENRLFKAHFHPSCARQHIQACMSYLMWCNLSNFFFLDYSRPSDLFITDQLWILPMSCSWVDRCEGRLGAIAVEVVLLLHAVWKK